jgi:dimethylargininase
MLRTAIVRKISSSMNHCELTFADRDAIDIAKAEEQHEKYVQTLKELNLTVIELPALNDLPDSVFVEDVAFILQGLAVITMPGAMSRRPEIISMSEVLPNYVPNIIKVELPGTIDGGDVLVIAKRIYIGVSTRSNEEGISQLQEKLKPYGYEVIGIRVQRCLHLKSTVTRIDDNTLLINPDWVDKGYFTDYTLVEVDPTEENAANVVSVNGTLLYSSAFPKTLAKLRALGYNVIELELSEIAKAEGAVTCCSLLIS